MANNVNIEGINPCTGCSICSVACPKSAISIELTKEGFYQPIIDDKLCVDCGLCIKNCYKYDREASKSSTYNVEAYSAINLDQGELGKSTSGGVACEIAKEYIKRGHKVLGVAYDYEENIAITKIASTIYETEEFKGSKYFQSYTESAFKEAIEDETDQQYVVFGTPCQIYGINKIVTAKHIKQKFLLVDIFCHGCPSINLWKKYLQHTKEKLNCTSFNKIEFRSKAHGWHEFCTTFKGKQIEHNSNKINDPFYTIFFDGNAFNRACYNCGVRSTLNYADIRLGDYWGQQYDTNTSGVSAVVICSEKGKQVFSQISHKFITKEHSFEETIKAQSYGKLHKFDVEKRDAMMNLLQSDLSMAEIFRKSKNSYSIKKRIKMLSKNVIKRLPPKVYFRIKKLVHSMNK